jgi:hypothetical protein
MAWWSVFLFDCGASVVCSSLRVEGRPRVCSQTKPAPAPEIRKTPFIFYISM